MVNYYQVLGVRENATQAEIKMAYKKLALAYHPDVHGGSKAKEDIFKSISEAYTALSDPDKRASHDRKLSYYRFTPTSPSTRAAQGPAGPNPYGNPFTYKDFAGGSQAPEDQWRPSEKPRALRFPNMHDVAIALLIIACVVTGGIWLNSVMSRKAAIAQLAEGDFIGALNFDKNYAPAWYAFARARMKTGNFEGALENLDKAILLADTVPAFWYVQRAELHTLLGQDEYARRDVLAFLKVHPRADSVRLILAAIYLRRADPDSALNALKAVASAEAFHQQHQVVYNHLAGMGNFHSGNFLLAEKYFGQNADYNYNVPEDLYLRGLCRLRLADTARAAADLREAALYGSEEADSLLAGLGRR